VIRRRDGIAAYQVASLADDIDHDIDLIVRGADLLMSTAAQLYLASLIGADEFFSNNLLSSLTDTGCGRQ
jgi:glutamyl-tRNA synthetase